MNQEKVEAIVDKNGGNRAGLISILEDIQSKFGYLPEEALKLVARRTDRSLVDIYGVATFYKNFSLEPRGRHQCSVCMGTACHVRGAPMITEEFERRLKSPRGKTTEDKEFTLETVNCVGACALGPIVVMDGHYFSNVKPSDVKKIIKKTREGLDKVDVEKDSRIFPLHVRCPRCNHSLMDSEYTLDDFPSIRVTMSFNGKHGWLRLSSLYGSYSVESEYDITEETVVDFFCPHCHAEIKGTASCADCGAPLVSMTVEEGGMIQICSRRGCKGHMLDLDGVNFEA